MKRFKIFYVDSIDQDGNEVIHHVFINAMSEYEARIWFNISGFDPKSFAWMDEIEE